MCALAKTRRGGGRDPRAGPAKSPSWPFQTCDDRVVGTAPLSAGFCELTGTECLNGGRRSRGISLLRQPVQRPEPIQNERAPCANTMRKRRRHILMSNSRPPTPKRAYHHESAGEFVKSTAETLQAWLHDMAVGGASKGKRWILSATLSSGAMVDVFRLCAHGHSMIRIEGELPDGSPCLLITHQNSVQLLAYHISEQPEERPKREIGFHTGIGTEIRIRQ